MDYITDTADAGIRKNILYVAQNFENDVALKKLDKIEKRILDLGEDPYVEISNSSLYNSESASYFHNLATTTL